MDDKGDGDGDADDGDNHNDDDDDDDRGDWIESLLQGSNDDYLLGVPLDRVPAPGSHNIKFVSLLCAILQHCSLQKRCRAFILLEQRLHLIAHRVLRWHVPHRTIEISSLMFGRTLSMKWFKRRILFLRCSAFSCCVSSTSAVVANCCGLSTSAVACRARLISLSSL